MPKGGNESLGRIEWRGSGVPMGIYLWDTIPSVPENRTIYTNPFRRRIKDYLTL